MTEDHKNDAELSLLYALKYADNDVSIAAVAVREALKLANEDWADAAAALREVFLSNFK